MTGKILSLHVSAERGVNKTDVERANVIAEWGIEGDAHAGAWDRQISVFPIEALEKVPIDKKDEVENDGYTENITISGIPLEKLCVGSILTIGSVKIKILHIGKEEFKENGRPYIVSREGRFGIVLAGGIVKINDAVAVE